MNKYELKIINLLLDKYTESISNEMSAESVDAFREDIKELYNDGVACSCCSISIDSDSNDNQKTVLEETLKEFARMVKKMIVDSSYYPQFDDPTFTWSNDRLDHRLSEMVDALLDIEGRKYVI